MIGISFRRKKRIRAQDPVCFHLRGQCQITTPTQTEDLRTKVWPTVNSTLITQGEPAVKTVKDFHFCSQTSPDKENKPNNRPASKAQNSAIPEFQDEGWQIPGR